MSIKITRNTEVILESERLARQHEGWESWRVYDTEGKRVFIHEKHWKEYAKSYPAEFFEQFSVPQGFVQSLESQAQTRMRQLLEESLSCPP